MAERLLNKRVLITQADDYMGPATVELFAPRVRWLNRFIRSSRADRCAELINEAGEVDVLIANLASENFSGIAANELSDEDWHTAFDIMVHPLHRLCRAVLPQMLAREAGKIIVYGSAAALRGMRTLTAYSAARSAQVGYVQALGVEVAPKNIQVNLIAQNYVENPVYYPSRYASKKDSRSPCDDRFLWGA